MDCTKKIIADGITLVGVNASRFKTNEVSVSLAVPLSRETVSSNALLINLLSRKNREYPSISLLNKRLAYLYGASLVPSVAKTGECQVLKLAVTCLDDRFSLDGESISYACVKLLTSLLFQPRLDENGNFYAEDIEAEKRLLLEKLDSEENEKRIYALRQAESLMFQDEPYGINRYGDREDIKNLTCGDILHAWRNLLSQSRMMVSVIGNADFEKIEKHLSDVFCGVERCCNPLPKVVFVARADDVKDKTERMDVKQGKLVLGFRVNLKPEDALTPAMRTFCDVFGGGPYSKLFANVREKMSLCYYCSARYTRQKSCIMIQCGCNEESMDKAIEEILHQLDEIKNGNFDEELASSKMALRDAIMSVNDTPEALENWYSAQIADENIKSPETAINENDSVAKQQVEHCASLVTLDTVYRLVCNEEV